ncbi:MAG: PD-(D/E)XK nuclease domain-containing protein [Treponema sp.]|nr:PD-(D/E)XK nuclease domain-containing protein [Treponema sp.]
MQERNLDGFIRRIKTLFSLISYELSDDTERHYQALFFMAFTLMGAFVQAAVRSAAGRADALVSTRDTVGAVFDAKTRTLSGWKALEE